MSMYFAATKISFPKQDSPDDSRSLHRGHTEIWQELEMGDRNTSSVSWKEVFPKL